MFDYSARLFPLIEDSGMSYGELAKETGISKSALQRYATGATAKIPLDRIEKLADALGVSATYLMGWDGSDSLSPEVLDELGGDTDAAYEFRQALDADQARTAEEPRQILRPVAPVLNFRVMTSVKAGYGCAPVEDYSDEYEQLPSDMINGYAPDDCKVMRVTGSSMYPRILEGDKVLVHIQPEVENGEVAVVLCNDGAEGTLKKVVKRDDYIELVPANPEYETRRIEGGDLEGFRIYGRVIKLIRDF